MISYIKGKVSIKSDGYIVLENNGIGYHINVPAVSKAYLADNNEDVMIYTVMSVREDDISLYGFTDILSLEIFKKLTSVSGVGAKAALSILSSLTPENVKKSVVFNDPDSLTKAQGVGKKTAQRIVLELKDKLEAIDVGSPVINPEDINGGDSQTGSMDEAVEALVSLGYSKIEALEAVAAAGLKDASAEEYIKAALKSLSIM